MLSPAAQFRRAVTQEFRDFEATIGEDEEVWTSVCQPTREIYFKIGQISSADAGMFNFFGEDETGKLINLTMHYTLVSYQLHAVSAHQPRRIGFGIDGGTKENGHAVEDEGRRPSELNSSNDG